MPATTTRRRLPHPAGRLGDAWDLVVTTISACFRYRVLGLAAETAFYALLSLPPLFFGLAGAIGFIARSFDVASIATFRSEILRVAGRFLTPDAIANVLRPTLDDVLGKGRADVVSIGFLIALWSGSRAIAVLVDTCTIMYGARGTRGMVRSRALSFVIYLVLLAAGAILLPLVLAGPEIIQHLLPGPLAWLGRVYWPIIVVGSIAMLASVYDIAMPIQQRWRAHLPGSVLTFALWLGGSLALRAFLVGTLGGASLYGPLAAPIALMMWLYVTALAALVGAAFNAAVASVWPAFAGLTPREEEHLLEEAPPRA